MGKEFWQLVRSRRFIRLVLTSFITASAIYT
jgi:hypothetical protein